MASCAKGVTGPGGVTTTRRIVSGRRRRATKAAVPSGTPASTRPIGSGSQVGRSSARASPPPASTSHKPAASIAPSAMTTPVTTRTTAATPGSARTRA